MAWLWQLPPSINNRVLGSDGGGVGRARTHCIKRAVSTSLSSNQLHRRWVRDKSLQEPKRREVLQQIRTRFFFRAVVKIEKRPQSADPSYFLMAHFYKVLKKKEVRFWGWRGQTWRIWDTINKEIGIAASHHQAVSQQGANLSNLRFNLGLGHKHLQGGKCWAEGLQDVSPPWLLISLWEFTNYTIASQLPSPVSLISCVLALSRRKVKCQWPFIFFRRMQKTFLIKCPPTT